MKIIKDIQTLKAMARRNLITLHEDTGVTVKHWSGLKVKACYIQDGPREFEYKHKTYGVRYFSGCFSPFVVHISDSPMQYAKSEERINTISFV